MEKSEFRVLTKHYFLCGKRLSETKAKLDKYYSDSTPSYGPSPGGTNEITTPEMINKIHVKG